MFTMWMQAFVDNSSEDLPPKVPRGHQWQTIACDCVYISITIIVSISLKPETGFKSLLSCFKYQSTVPYTCTLTKWIHVIVCNRAEIGREKLDDWKWTFSTSSRSNEMWTQYTYCLPVYSYRPTASDLCCLPVLKMAYTCVQWPTWLQHRFFIAISCNGWATMCTMCSFEEILRTGLLFGRTGVQNHSLAMTTAIWRQL